MFKLLESWDGKQRYYKKIPLYSLFDRNNLKLQNKVTKIVISGTYFDYWTQKDCLFIQLVVRC